MTLNLPKGYLSVSQINLYLSCPKKYKFAYIDELESIRTPALAEGLIIHRALEKIFREILTNQKMIVKKDLDNIYITYLDEIKDTVEFWGDQSPDKLRQRDSTLLDTFYDDHLPLIWPLDVECGLDNFEISNIPIVGVIDLKFHPIDSEGNLQDQIKIIADHKVTGRAKGQHEIDESLQLTVYSMSTGISNVQINNFVTSIKDPSKQIKILRGERNIYHFNWATEIVSQVAQGISAGYFPPCSPTEVLCSPKYCQYHQLCKGVNPCQMNQ